jgi:hypothetical protein
LISARSFFGARLLEKRAEPVDPSLAIGVPHDAIERLSYLVQVRRSMIQKVRAPER